jgi:hypothetical protein
MLHRRFWLAALAALSATACPETGSDGTAGDGGTSVTNGGADGGATADARAADTGGAEAGATSDAGRTDTGGADPGPGRPGPDAGGRSRCAVARFRLDGELREATCARGVVPVGGPLHELTLQISSHETLRIQLPSASAGRSTGADCLDATFGSAGGAYQAHLSGRNFSLETQRNDGDGTLTGSFSGDLCRVVATIVIDGRVSHTYACRSITDGSFAAPIEAPEAPCGCSVLPADDSACFVATCSGGACMPRICPLASAACAAGAPRPTGTFTGQLGGSGELRLTFDAAGTLQRLSLRHPELRGAPPEPPAEVTTDYVLDPVPASAVLVEGARTTLTMTTIGRATGEPPPGQIFLQWQTRQPPGGPIELSVHGSFTYTAQVFGNTSPQTETLSGTLR